METRSYLPTRNDSSYPHATYFRRLSQKNICEDDGEEVFPSTKSSGYYASNFVELRRISRGSFASVHACLHVVGGVTLGLFAVKKIPVGKDEKYLTKVLKEVRILEDVARHPNVVQYNHSWIDEAKISDFGPVVPCLFILMEYASEGSLDIFVERSGSALSNSFVWYFFLCAVSGVHHLHSHNILHRDLKPQNLLLAAQDDINSLPRLMVGDFGTSCDIEISESSSRTGGTGTAEYMAPELFVLDPQLRKYSYSSSRASDMWSLGMILHYLMAHGKLPQVDDRNQCISFDLDVQSRPAEMVELLRSLLSFDPRLRPSCADILRSPLVNSMKEKISRNFASQNTRSAKSELEKIQIQSVLSRRLPPSPPAVCFRPTRNSRRYSRSWNQSISDTFYAFRVHVFQQLMNKKVGRLCVRLWNQQISVPAVILLILIYTIITL